VEGSPKTENWEFRRGASRVCARPVLKVNGFQDVTTALMPTLLPRTGEVPENSAVSFFPGVPKDESGKELPNAIEESRVEGRISPVQKSFKEAVPVAVRGTHNDCCLIPDLIGVGAGVEEMI
jgi:hypothetical protein